MPRIEQWRVWLKCIGQAVVQVGLPALVGQIPFVGKVISAVAAATCALVRKEEEREEDRRILLQEMVQASDQQILQAAEEAAQTVAAGLSAEVRERLTIYLMQVPAVARQSLRRTEDPTGNTVAADQSLSRPEDVLPLLPTRAPRFKIGDRPLPGVDWELEQLLGVGGFGEVWKARNPRFDSVAPAALKFCLDPEAKERLLGHEAALLNQVMRKGRHPGIVALKHTYLSADPPCLEYEYVAGGDLGTLIQKWHQKRPADLVQRVLRAMTGLAKIIAFAHQLNPPIVHRDLKPANILLQPKGDGTSALRVADFGIGGVAAQQALAETKSGTTPPAHILGASMLGSYTPLYASPQQMRGSQPDPRDDVHALGVIWLQMLTGDLTQGAVADWRDELADLKIPEAVLQVLAKCLASKSEKRLANAGALLKALNVVGQTFLSAGATVKELLETSQPVEKPMPGGSPIDHLSRSPPCITNSLGMKFVRIEPGTFLMGSPPNDYEATDDEKPQHQVTLTKAFYLGIHLVTRSQFAQFVRETGYKTEAEKHGGGYLYTGSKWVKDPKCNWRRTGFEQDDLHPVVVVSWNDAQHYLAWLEKKDGRPYRLPTEAEWEYACRAGTTTRFFTGDDPNSLAGYANVADSTAKKEFNWADTFDFEDGYVFTSPVGAFKPNPWGLFDMTGNVREWCQDYFDEKAYQRNKCTDPVVNKGTNRVLRGGSWYYSPRYCRSACRYHYAADDGYYNFGFRLVLSARENSA